MSFSFIEIEESKTRVIALVFIFIVFFYFLTAYLLLIVIENSLAVHFPEMLQREVFFLPPVKHTLLVFILALAAALTHWIISTDNLIQKITLAIGAMPFDPKDTYHQYFKNIVDEVAVAMGGRLIEAMVIPSPGMNAFSVQGFNGRAIIGVTEGLLTRLNRPQIEAVVAHEAGHIAGGDSLSTTVVSSLSEIYEEILSKLRAGIGKARGRGTAAMILIYAVLVIMHFLSSLLRYFISREREYRADAIAVRLTRNPLGLAEALKLISSHWRGAGGQGQRLEAIFIVNPRHSKLEERQGLFSDIFSTHPPVKKRIQILLSMAHLDEKTLEDNLKNFRRVSPVAVAEFKPADSAGPKRWFISRDQKWLGPFLLSELRQLEGFRPDQWVRMQGQDAVMPAYEDRDLKKIFTQNKEAGFNCPHCKTALEEMNYEGVPMLKCPYCEGALVEQNKVSRILLRSDVKFSEDTVRLAQSIINSKAKYKLKEIDSGSAWVLSCPQCGRTMRRQFFVYSYPVEIDRCMYCTGIWFDKQELELLQYIYEHRDKYFNGKYF